MRKVKNLIGRIVARRRTDLGWTQADLSDRLYDAGWPLSRSEVSKLEGGLIHVYEFQLFYLAEVLETTVESLLPQRNPTQPVHDSLLRNIHHRAPMSDDVAEQTGAHIFFRRSGSRKRSAFWT
jgi:transcriptional regulator with XRE-family HTH domain